MTGARHRIFRAGYPRVNRSNRSVEHRSVVLVQESGRDMHTVVGRDADKVMVIRAMVDRAEREPVPDSGNAVRVIDYRVAGTGYSGR
jgi:hypothetical protein